MNNIGEKIKLYFRKRKHRLSFSGISVRGDWFIIIVLTSVLLVAGLVYVAWLYKGITNGRAFSNDEVPQVENTDNKKEEIVKTVEYLNGGSF